MKKSLFAIAAACVALAACNKEQNPARNFNQEEGRISLSITCEDSMTKALPTYSTITAQKDVQPYEGTVNNVQVFVFGTDGKIQFYKHFGNSTNDVISTTAGNKNVWVVVNHPDLSSIATEDELKTKAVSLDNNSKTDSKGFLMTGFASCEVLSGETVSCSVPVSRLVSRVVLCKVENCCPKAYGDITVNRVYLTNVVGNQQLDGGANPSAWCNVGGRANSDPQSIINGSSYQAQYETLTYFAPAPASPLTIATNASDVVPRYFYSYPNPSAVTSDVLEDGLQSKLVIEATVNGTVCYYPILLSNKLERNTTYSVGVTITGPGSDDPNKLVKKGIIGVTVVPEPWAGEAIYNEVI